MCWGAGILLSSGVVRGVSSLSGDIAWRLPFAIQWVWPVPLFIVAYLAPESPWNAVRRGNIEQAKKSLMRLLPNGADKEQRLARTIAYIDYTTRLEKRDGAEVRFVDCFKGANLRRTEIVSFAPRI
jgi:MFS transporter, SP family, general alpha glucoside:H+ symporter